MSLLPVLARIGGITIYTWGFMLGVAFLVGIFIIRKELARKGMEPDLAYDLAVYAMIAGLLGARLTYVAGHAGDYAKNPLAALEVWQGGLVFYGGLAAGAVAILALIRRRNLNVAKVADAIAPALAIGSAIGRLGCFARGCCYGVSTSLPWGVTFTDARSAAPLGIPLHPTQLYEFGYNVAIFAVLWALRKRIKEDGFLFWLFLGLYGAFRFLVEFLRVRPIIALGLGGSQLFSIALMAASLVAIVARYSSVFLKGRRTSAERVS